MRKETKLRVVCGLVWPVLTYGSEAWTLRLAEIRAIRASEMWVYRRMLRISWRERRTNVSVLEEFSVKLQAMEMVKRKKLVFYGHVYRRK